MASGLNAVIHYFYNTLEVGAEAITSIVPGCANEEELEEGEGQIFARGRAAGREQR